MLNSLSEMKKASSVKSKNIYLLPAGDALPALKFPYFPARWQAVIWRNWELVPAERIARVLRTDKKTVLAAAAELGLRVPPLVEPRWLKRGYITIIKSNWHLLPYGQLLELLDWPVEKLAYTLREDDFLWHKVGYLKPSAAEVYYHTLDAAARKRTFALKKTIARHFPSASKTAGEPPFFFLKRFRSGRATGKDRFGNFDLRLVYSYSAVYGDPLLDSRLDPYPDDLLAAYRDCGVNGIWLQGVLYSLVPWKIAPELSSGFEIRLKNLRRLTERAAKHGIGVYLYLNEPRPLPLKYFKRYPEWKGVEYPEHGVANCCTSHGPVLDLLENATETLFRKAPELAGVFTITMSENPTNCFSRWQEKKCPRCSKRRAEEAIADVNAAIERGAHRSKPSARVIVWDWAWDQKWAHAAVDLLPENVELMCVSEWGVPTDIGGIKGSVIDYSISQPGPSDRARKMWEHAGKRGLKTIAKIQINNTWECSAIPYIPVPDLAEKHLQNLSGANVGGLMLSWTLGGYPGGNLELFKKTPLQIAGEFGKQAAPHVRKGQLLLSKAFTEFPFALSTLYNAPHTIGPANLLYDKPTGYAASLFFFPYDDLDGWRSRSCPPGIPPQYPAKIFEKQFAKLADRWHSGLSCLVRALKKTPPARKDKMNELLRMVEAAYCHFRSACLQIGFIRLRNTGRKREILKIIREEMILAKALHNIVAQDSRVGFEACNQYYYTLNDLKEKILNCEYLLKKYSRKEKKHGIPR